MTSVELFKALRPRGGSVVLDPESTVLGELANCIRSVTGASGKLRIEKPVQTDGPPEGTLIVTGSVRLGDMVCSGTKAVFTLDGGSVVAFHVVVPLDPAFILGGISISGADTRLLVIASGKGAISDTELNLAETSFSAGATLVLKSTNGAVVCWPYDVDSVVPLRMVGGMRDLEALTGKTLSLTLEVVPSGFAVESLRLGGDLAGARLRFLDADDAPMGWKMPLGNFERVGMDVAILRGDRGDAKVEAIATSYFGSAAIAGIDGWMFDVDYVPNGHLSGVLNHGHGDKAQGFAETLAGGGLDLPNFDLTLRSASIVRDLTGGVTTVSVDLGGELDLLGNGALVLKETSLSVVKGKKGIESLSLGAEAALGKLILRMGGVRDSVGGWVLTGSVNPVQPLPLGELVDTLVHGFGATVPTSVTNALSSVSLKSLGVIYSQKTRDLCVEADTQWSLPKDILWAGDKSFEALIRVQTSRPPESQVRQTTVDLYWKHQAPESGQHQTPEYVFEAGANFGPDGQQFFVNWDGTGEDGKGTSTLGIGTLVKKLNLPAVPDGWADWSILNFHRLSVNFDRTSRSKVLNLLADSSLAGGLFEVEAVLGGKHPSFRAVWKPSDAHPDATLGLEDLLKSVGVPVEDSRSALGEFLAVFTFKRLAIQYGHRPQPTLFVTATSAHGDGFDKVLIGALKGKAGWGVVFGVTFSGKTAAQLLHLEDTPVVGQLLGIFVPRFLLVSTADKFTLPADAKGDDGVDRSSVTPPPFVDEDGSRTSPFGSSKLRLRKGATVAGTLDFTRNELGRVLNRQFGWTKLDARLCLAAGGVVDAEAVIPGEFSLPTGRQFELCLHDARVAFTAGKGVFAAAVRGSCDVRLFEVHQRYDLDLAVSTNGVDGRLHVADGIPSLPEVRALPGLRWKKEYYVDVGIVFEPPGFKFGLDAGFHIGPDPDKYAGTVQVVLDMEGPIPNPIYLGGSIHRLDLWAMFELGYGISRMLEAGDSAAKLVGEESNPARGALAWVQKHYQNLQTIADLLHLENARFHWAETAVTLPDGNVAAPGVGFEGTMDIAGWKAYGLLEFSTSPPGLMADLELSPLELGGVLSVTGDGKGVRRDGKVIVPAGGAVMRVDSGKPPFLHASLHVTLFDLLHADVQADITDEGFLFELGSSAGDFAEMKLGCSLRTKGGVVFDAHGSFSLHLDAHIGPIIPGLDFTEIHLNAGLDGHINIHATSDAFEVTVGGSFEFEGVRLTLPDLTLTVAFGKMADLAVKILEHIRDKASEIFSEVWDFVSRSVEAAAKAVAEVAEKAVEKVKEIGKEALHAAAVVGTALADGAKKVGQELAAAAVAVADEARHLATEAAAKVGELLDSAGKLAAQWAHEAEAVFQDAVAAAGKIADAVAKEVAQIAAEIAHAFEEVEHAIAAIAQEVARVIGHLLEDAKAVAEAIAREADAIVQGIEHAISAVWDEINALVQRAAEAIKNAASAAINGIGNFVTTGSC